MRAVVVEQPGGLEKLALAQVPEPVPGPGEVQIRIAFGGSTGAHSEAPGRVSDPVEYPVVLGAEVSGIVVRGRTRSPELPCRRSGRALVGPHFAGGFAEFCVTESRYVMPLPSGMSLKLERRFPSWRSPLSPPAQRPPAAQRETVLIHASAVRWVDADPDCGPQGREGDPAPWYAGQAAAPLALGAHVVVDTNPGRFRRGALDFTNGRGLDLRDRLTGSRCPPEELRCAQDLRPGHQHRRGGGLPDFDIRRSFTNGRPRSPGSSSTTRPGSLARWARGVCSHVLRGSTTDGWRFPIQGVHEPRRRPAAQHPARGRGSPASFSWKSLGADARGSTPAVRAATGPRPGR